MGFIQLTGIEDIKEPEIAPQGSYDMVVSKADEKTRDDGSVYWQISLEFTDYAEYRPVTLFLSIPDSGMDEKRRRNALLTIKRFMLQAGLNPAEGFDPSLLPGTVLVGCNVVQTVSAKDGNTYNNVQLNRAN